MRQVFLDEGAVSIKEVCQPLLDDYSVLISVSYSYMSTGKGLKSVLQSNNQYYLGSIPEKIRHLVHLVSNKVYNNPNLAKKASDLMPLGQSCSGMVLAVGKKVKKFCIGDFVACTGDDLAHHADIVCVPENLVVQISKDSLKEGCLTGIGAMAMQTIRRAQIQLGDYIAIIGLETLGQLMIQLCRLSGARVIALDTNPERLEMAKLSGAEYTFDLNQVELISSLRSIASSHGLDSVIVSPDSMYEDISGLVLEMTRKKGKIIVAGNRETLFNRELAYQKELSILFSFSHGPGRYDQAYEYEGYDYPYSFVRWTENRNLKLFSNMILKGQLNLDHLITKEVKLSEVSSKKIENKSTELGFILDYENEYQVQKEECPIKQLEKKLEMTKFIPARKENVGISFYGVNPMVEYMLLPILSEKKEVFIDRIIDRNVVNALNAAKEYTGALALSGGVELFHQSKNTDAIIFGSTQNVSFEHLLSVLEHNKTVMLAHPLPTNKEEELQLTDFFKDNPDAKLFYCFYRTYSKFVSKIKNELHKRSLKSLMLSYRVNLSSLQQNDQYHNQEGNIISRASHILDLLCYLIQANPMSISVESLSPRRNHIFPTDNFSCNINFDDGSVGNILFTNLGFADSGAERMEVFFDSKTIVMEDYTRLAGFGLPQTFDEIIRKPDFGYNGMIDEYLSLMKKPKKELVSLIKRWNVVQKLTISLDNLACQGGGEVQL